MEALEFMKPRFEVIANYPDCDKHNVFVGGVIEFDHFDEHAEQWFNDNGKTKFFDAYYAHYPHIFRKLSWWEKRTDEELLSVKYVKRIGRYKNGVISTVAAPDQDFRQWHVDNEVEFRFIQDNSFMPVSKEEYDAYMSSVIN